MLQYTLSEISKVAKQAKLVKAVKEDLSKRGLEFKDYKAKVQRAFEYDFSLKRTLISPSDFKGLETEGSEKVYNSVDFKLGLDKIGNDYRYHYDAQDFVANDFPNTNLSVEEYKEMLAYFANSALLLRDDVRKKSPSFNQEDLPVMVKPLPVKGNSGTIDLRVNISSDFSLTYLYQIASHKVLTSRPAWDSYSNKQDYLSYFF